MIEAHGDELSTQTPLESREVHKGRIVHLAIDTVRYPDGSTGDLEMIRHSGAAAVLPFLDPLDDPDPRVILVRQYRYAGGGYLYEVPAGRPDRAGEPWEECARRELQEETGYTSTSIIPLTSILTTPGFTDERIYLFAATDLTPGEVVRDFDEFMETVTLPFSEAVDLVRSGSISDGKTICTLLYAAQFLRS